MPYQHIAYVSCAVRPLTPEEIDRLLLDARDYNQKTNITGVLLCQNTTFFQFFEGLPEDVEEVYKRIKASGKHNNILELVCECSENRYFSDWAMGFCHIPKSEMQALEDAKWKGKIPSTQIHAETSLAIKLMLEFWNKLNTI